MALIQCSECGKQISDKAKACPECGCPIDVILNASYDNDSSMCEYKAIDAYNYKEMDSRYGEYGIRQLFNIAVNYHYDVADGALEAAFIYKYIIERYTHNTEASESRVMLLKLADEKPGLFIAQPSHTIVTTTSSSSIISKNRKHLDEEEYDWSWPAFLFSGLWALYNRLWSKFIIVIVVSIATPILFKTVYTIFAIVFANKINSYNTFMLTTILFYVLFLICPLSITAVWFGKNGNKWINNRCIKTL